MTAFLDLGAGLSPDAAIEAFLDGCNRPDRMNISAYRQRTVLPDLRRVLPDPITQPVAEALTEVAMRRRRLEEVIEWLQLQPMTWDHYVDIYVADRQRQGQIDEMARGYAQAEAAGEPSPDLSIWWKRTRGRFPRTAAQAKARYADDARPCPQCGAPPDHLRWMEHCAPLDAWQHGVGAAGWMTMCDTCRLRVDCFVDVMS